MADRQQVKFYFDPISPYAWIASVQLPIVEKQLDVEFVFEPVLFAGLLNSHGQKGPAEIPAKRAYTMKDAMRWASKLGLKFEGPPAHPFNPLKALRTILAIDDLEKRKMFAIKLMTAIWALGIEPTATEGFVPLLEEQQLDAKKILEKTQTQEIKDKLRANTEAAIKAGVFGVPTFVAGQDIFWGADRLPFLLDHLQGKLSINPEQYLSVLNRPRAADRKGI